MNGFYGIGVYCPKTAENIGTLWRSAQNFGAAFIFTIGHRYKYQPTDVMKTWRNIPLHNFPDFEAFSVARPTDVPLIGIEFTSESRNLDSFSHPRTAVYLLGSEDNGLPLPIIEKCQAVVHINSFRCLNVAVAGSIVMYDRQNKTRGSLLTSATAR